MVDNSVNNLAHRDALDIVLTGDVILDAGEPDHWLEELAKELRAAHLAIGHLEVPHTVRGTETSDDVAAPAADPAAIAALARAGYRVMTLAGNHIMDQGAAGLEDTMAALADAGIAFCGAGSDLEAARRPALVTVESYTIAVLSYNCVGPESGWASESRAGCAYLPVLTRDGSSVSPTAPLAAPDDAATGILAEDIAAARRRADLVIVAMHKGIVHTPAKLDDYERPLARLAIDQGADVVVSHHAHIVKGIETYLGRPIYHGLGNGCVVTHALAPDQDHEGRAAWARRRRELFGFEPDPEYYLAPFHPEATNAMCAKLAWMPGKGLRPGIVPVDVVPPGKPEPAASERAGQIARYVESVTRNAGLPELQFVHETGGWFVKQ